MLLNRFFINASFPCQLRSNAQYGLPGLEAAETSIFTMPP